VPVVRRMSLKIDTAIDSAALPPSIRSIPSSFARIPSSLVWSLASRRFVLLDACKLFQPGSSRAQPSCSRAAFFAWPSSCHMPIRFLRRACAVLLRALSSATLFRAGRQLSKPVPMFRGSTSTGQPKYEYTKSPLPWRSVNFARSLNRVPTLYKLGFVRSLLHQTCKCVGKGCPAIGRM
jgi:hypothetical protein